MLAIAGGYEMQPEDTRPLTPRQKQVLEFICQHIRERGYAPSHDEIRASYDGGSIRGAQVVLKNLERKGFIERDYGVKRGLRVVRQP